MKLGFNFTISVNQHMTKTVSHYSEITKLLCTCVAYLPGQAAEKKPRSFDRSFVFALPSFLGKTFSFSQFHEFLIKFHIDSHYFSRIYAVP